MAQNDLQRPPEIVAAVGWHLAQPIADAPSGGILGGFGADDWLVMRP